MSIVNDEDGFSRKKTKSYISLLMSRLEEQLKDLNAIENRKKKMKNALTDEKFPRIDGVSKQSFVEIFTSRISRSESDRFFEDEC